MIPVLDLGLSDDKNEQSKELVSILSTTGFVYLKNHGVSEDVIRASREDFAAFFSKSLEYKESYVENRPEMPFHGYKGFESEKLNPDQPEKDAREAIAFWAHEIEDNRWPDSSMKNDAVALVRQMGLLANRILKMLGVGFTLHSSVDYLA